ncbi:MAG TPA: hypothetical protein VF492_01560, partial [Verrucomicrobiae bacterium]
HGRLGAASHEQPRSPHSRQRESEGGRVKNNFNIQQPTSNTQHPVFTRADHWMLDVGCSMLDVFLPND